MRQVRESGPGVMKVSGQKNIGSQVGHLTKLIGTASTHPKVNGGMASVL